MRVAGSPCPSQPKLLVYDVLARHNFIGTQTVDDVPEAGRLFPVTDKMGSRRPEQEVEEVLITSQVIKKEQLEAHLRTTIASDDIVFFLSV